MKLTRGHWHPKDVRHHSTSTGPAIPFLSCSFTSLYKLLALMLSYYFSLCPPSPLALLIEDDQSILGTDERVCNSLSELYRPSSSLDVARGWCLGMGGYNAYILLLLLTVVVVQWSEEERESKIRLSSFSSTRT